jgi:hypothetical protein
VIVVPDAGPLIYLGAAGQLDLLRHLFAQVVVPRAVRDEVVVAGAGDLGAAEVAAATWLVVVDSDADQALLATLDAGESAAIPLAERLGATLLCDDGMARAEAVRRGLAIIGTLGVLALAKRQGLLERVAPVAQRMADLGMYIAAPLLDEVLALAGEK